MFFITLYSNSMSDTDITETPKETSEPTQNESAQKEGNTPSESSARSDSDKKKKYDKPKILFEWQGPARAHVQRDRQFYTTLVIATLVVGFIFVLLSQYTLTLVVFAFAFAVYAANKYEPHTVHYQILNDSVKLDEDQYYYGDLGVFWFVHLGDQVVLKIATYLSWPRRIEIVIRPEDQDAIEEQLLHHLPYQEVKEGKVTSFIERAVLPTGGGRTVKPVYRSEEKSE